MYISLPGTSFNSTLVQLKGSYSGGAILSHDCFNSTLVQLKVGNIIVGNLGYPCFNSTLVQLKVLAKGIRR